MPPFALLNDDLNQLVGCHLHVARLGTNHADRRTRGGRGVEVELVGAILARHGVVGRLSVERRLKASAVHLE